MKLFFEDSTEQLRLIAELDSGLPKTELAKAIDNTIRSFCAERDFNIPYMRVWNSQRDGEEATVFDVGSHSEFFVTVPASMDCFLATPGSEEDDGFRDWVMSVFDQEEEKGPFCPFRGPNHIGYCNVAYTDRCFTCEEAIGAYDDREEKV